MDEGFKVKLVDAEDKSIAQIEEQLIEEHQEQIEEKVETPVIEEEIETPIIEERTNEIDDNVVLSHIKTRYGKEINSLDDLFQERQANEELPEDVSAFLKYKKETGRGIKDFMELNRDFDSMKPETLLASYYKEQNPELDDEDIALEMERFSYDEDFDDDKEIKKKKLAAKKELAKAKDYFNNLKEQYKVPLESRVASVPNEEIEEFNAFKANRSAQYTQQEEQTKRQRFFAEKTDELFSDKFEGFGFSINENDKVTYKPADPKTLKEQQSSLGDFIGSFLDDQGFLKDAEGFHRAIAVAREPEKFAKFFYEKGKADSVVDFEKESKNIDMIRTAPNPTPNEGGLKIRAVDDGTSNNFKYKKR